MSQLPDSPGLRTTAPTVLIKPNPELPGEFLLTTELWLPRPIDEVFQYFGDARNLETITPPWLNFRIVSDPSIALGAGSLIDYRLRIRGFPIRWRTEISAWDPPYRFIDQQLRGPYQKWVHTHQFVTRDGGTFCTDRVEYRMVCGALANRLLVAGDLKRIFEFRHRTMQRVLGGLNH